MKKLFLLLLLSCSASFANPYNYPVTRVIDGDTFEISVDFLPKELGKKLTIRVLGVDTPEKSFRAKCEEERIMGEKASEFSKEVFKNSKKIQVEIKKWDKFGGRVLGDVLFDGKRISELLIENGYARPYFGEKKVGWCDGL